MQPNEALEHSAASASTVLRTRVPAKHVVPVPVLFFLQCCSSLPSSQTCCPPLPHGSGSAPLRHVNRQKVDTFPTSAATDGLQILLVIPHRAKATWTSPANRPMFEGRGRVRAPWGDQRQSQCPFRPSCSWQGAQPSFPVGSSLEQAQRILTEGEGHPDSRNRMPQ